MKLTDLDFSYPEELIGLEPQRPPRVMWVGDDGQPEELTLQDLLLRIPAGDVLVVNNTQVLKRRVFAKSPGSDIADLEVLFLSTSDQKQWQVLFPSKKFKVGDSISLPKNISAKLIQKGRPQVLETSEILPESYFAEVGELPLPPYIQKAREERHNRNQDQDWYQTAWASIPGSFAAPTASLHFSEADISKLKTRGVLVIPVTLHVGLGTFLPVTAEDLNDHEMHTEFFEISKESWQQILKAKAMGKKVWAMGTTACRALESAAGGKFQGPPFLGETNLLIQPGYQWKVVDRLLTNFHQPQSTLLALVSAFSELERVKSCYQWAIERKFRLFSYGDLTVWIRE